MIYDVRYDDKKIKEILEDIKVTVLTYDEDKLIRDSVIKVKCLEGENIERCF